MSTMTFPEPAIEAKFWMFKKYFLDKLAKDNIKVYPHVQYKQIIPGASKLSPKTARDVPQMRHRCIIHRFHRR